jgi:hypothetical protein
MKVVSFDTARVTWLFPIEEFAPASGSNAPTLLAEIAARYDFKKMPEITTRDDMAKQGLPFGLGKFKVDEERVTISDFIIYNDGIVAIAEKTEWADAFLADIFHWVKDKFGFREITSGIRKMYANTVVVDFEAPISRLISGYEHIVEILAAHTVTIMQNPAPMQFSRLDFELDKRDLKDGQVALPKFVLERRPGVDFSQERFFSTAPMHTAGHIAVLAEIEKLAANL